MQTIRKRLTKFEIASMIERLPGNIAWTNPSMATFFLDSRTRAEFVEWYNHLVDVRGLALSHIS